MQWQLQDDKRCTIAGYLQKARGVSQNELPPVGWLSLAHNLLKKHTVDVNGQQAG
ncbi:hypothetical protein [Paenibacillus durus]|uniref:hypothetical protein n=1 Tax=Paenibacillus durus TaxID=44251 RepID=UPI000A5758BB|nr:hypothetical protein [Paenibacillus durus]